MVPVHVVSLIFIQSQNNLFVELFLTYQEQNLLLNEKTFFIIPLLPEWLLLGSPKLMDPHPNQQHAGLQHSILNEKTIYYIQLIIVLPFLPSMQLNIEWQIRV